ILTYIPQVRANMQPPTNQTLAPCSSSGSTHNHITLNPAPNGDSVQVDCDFSGVAFTTTGFGERNVKFTACPPQSGGLACPPSAVIIRAQVNYASKDPSPATSITV